MCQTNILFFIKRVLIKIFEFISILPIMTLQITENVTFPTIMMYSLEMKDGMTLNNNLTNILEKGKVLYTKTKKHSFYFINTNIILQTMHMYYHFGRPPF